MFYDDSILSGTKTVTLILLFVRMFYDDSILSGTKTGRALMPYAL